MNKLLEVSAPDMDDRLLVMAERNSAGAMLPSMLTPVVSQQLMRMFRDPRVLEPHERGNLIAQLRMAVERAPHITEVRVLLGMALSVDLQAQEAPLEIWRIVDATAHLSEGRRGDTRGVAAGCKCGTVRTGTQAGNHNS